MSQEKEKRLYQEKNWFLARIISANLSVLLCVFCLIMSRYGSPNLSWLVEICAVLCIVFLHSSVYLSGLCSGISYQRGVSLKEIREREENKNGR